MKKMKMAARLILTGLLVVMLGGCMSTGIAWETREPAANETELIIQRPWSYMYSQLGLILVLDQGTGGSRTAAMGNGKKIRMIIPNGEHTLTAMIDNTTLSKGVNKNPKEEGKTLTFSASGSSVVYTLKFKSSMSTLQYIWIRE
jgi:hypothetical protein